MTIRLGNLCGVRVIWHDSSMFYHWGRHGSLRARGGSFCFGRRRVYWWWK